MHNEDFLRRTALSCAIRVRSGKTVQNATDIFRYLQGAQGEAGLTRRIMAVEAAVDADGQCADGIVGEAERIEAFLEGRDVSEFARVTATRMQPGDMRGVV